MKIDIVTLCIVLSLLGSPVSVDFCLKPFDATGPCVLESNCVKKERAIHVKSIVVGLYIALRLKYCVVYDKNRLR